MWFKCGHHAVRTRQWRNQSLPFLSLLSCRIGRQRLGNSYSAVSLSGHVITVCYSFRFFFSFCPKGSSVICDCLCALASCFLIWFCLVLFFSSFVARGLLLCAVLCVLVWSSPDQSVILSWLNQLRSNMNDNENFSAHNLTLKRQARIWSRQTMLQHAW